MHRFFADERGIQGGMAYLEAEYARHALRPGGRLCLEINPLYAGELAQWLGDSGFTVNQADDQYGRRRFIQATLCDR